MASRFFKVGAAKISNDTDSSKGVAKIITVMIRIVASWHQYWPEIILAKPCGSNGSRVRGGYKELPRLSNGLILV